MLQSAGCGSGADYLELPCAEPACMEDPSGEACQAFVAQSRARRKGGTPLRHDAEGKTVLERLSSKSSGVCVRVRPTSIPTAALTATP